MTVVIRGEATTATRLLAAVTDESIAVEAIAAELAGSDAAMADAIALVGRLAILPGEHARAMEARLDAILDAVALVVAERAR